MSAAAATASQGLPPQLKQDSAHEIADAVARQLDGLADRLTELSEQLRDRQGMGLSTTSVGALSAAVPQEPPRGEQPSAAKLIPGPQQSGHPPMLSQGDMDADVIASSADGDIMDIDAGIAGRSVEEALVVEEENDRDEETVYTGGPTVDGFKSQSTVDGFDRWHSWRSKTDKFTLLEYVARLEAFSPADSIWGPKMRAFFDLKEPARKGRIAHMVQSSLFTQLSCFVIIFNSVVTIYATHVGAQEMVVEGPYWARTMEACFVVYYIMEVGLKMCVHQLFFFWNEDWAWNIFDFSIVFTACFELVLTTFAQSLQVDMSYLRICRVLKISKILRSFKAFRFLAELRLMAECVLGSMISMLWACLFLCLVLLIAALVFVQNMTYIRVEEPQRIPPEIQDNVDFWFSSVSNAMLVLLQSTTGGEDWAKVYDAICLSGSTGAAMFLFYILFFTFAFYNIVTSLFLEKAMKLAAPDLETLMLERRRQEIALTKSLRSLIQQLDTDGNGTISVEELTTKLSDPEVSKFFELHDLNIRDAELFFQTLSSIARTDKLDIPSFVAGCMKMKGPATNLDMQALFFQVHLLADDLHVLKDGIRDVVGQRAMRNHRSYSAGRSCASGLGGRSKREHQQTKESLSSENESAPTTRP